MNKIVKSLVLGFSLISTLAHAVEALNQQKSSAGKLNFYECKANIEQRLRLGIGSKRNEVFIQTVRKKQCSLVTDLYIDSALTQLNLNRSPIYLESTDSVYVKVENYQAPEAAQWDLCDGEDKECFKNAMGDQEYGAFDWFTFTIIELNDFSKNSILNKIRNNQNYQVTSLNMK